MKYDLHLHSKFSKRPSQWVLQRLGCPESFSEPASLYRQLQAKGLSSITLTDHNTIAGCLEIAHLPGVFTSEEVTSYFPQDRCKVHVLLYGINEAIHADIQKARENLFDLVAYLRGHKIMHALAHPLFSINDKLTPAHIEELLVLFKLLEINGARDEEQNQVLRFIVQSLRAEDIQRLANQHGLEPGGREPWVKHLVGGSDDHSALNAGRVHTEVPGAATVPQFLAGLAAGQGVVHGQGLQPPHPGPQPLRHRLSILQEPLHPGPLPARADLAALSGPRPDQRPGAAPLFPAGPGRTPVQRPGQKPQGARASTGHATARGRADGAQRSAPALHTAQSSRPGGRARGLLV